MSEYERKFDAALDALSNTDMWKSNYAPPMLRTMRAFGLEARPPHFAGFWRITLGYAAWFGPVWGFLMWWFSWRGAGFSFWAAVGAAVVAGLLFGLIMARYYAKGRRKYRLPLWEDL